MSGLDDPMVMGGPETPPAFPVEFVFDVGGQTLTIPDEPVQGSADPKRGELRRRLEVIPPVSLSFTSQVQLFAPGSSHPVVVEATAARADTSGSLRLTAPTGWTVQPAEQALHLARAGEHQRATFSVTAPASPGSAEIVATVQVNGASYGSGRVEIRY